MRWGGGEVGLGQLCPGSGSGWEGGPGPAVPSDRKPLVLEKCGHVSRPLQTQGRILGHLGMTLGFVSAKLHSISPKYYFNLSFPLEQTDLK